MPLRLYPPSTKRRTPYWTIRGHYLGVRINQSTGSGEESFAKKRLKALERDIESGAVSGQKVTGFAAAATAYMQAGGDNSFLGPIIKHFGTIEIDRIDQTMIDGAAAAIYPDASMPTRNRQVYTPIIAVLRRAGIEKRFQRPKGWRSPKAVSWLRREQAFAVLAAADDIDREFGLFLRTLLYTGMRLSEATTVKLNQLDLKYIEDKRSKPFIYLPKTKNSDPRRVHLTPYLATALANHPRSLDRNQKDKLFRFSINGRLRIWLWTALEKAHIILPPRQRGFHLFRHTWAMWMRKDAGLDTSGLVETGAWKDRSSAARYEHLDATEEAEKANLLPVPKR